MHGAIIGRRKCACKGAGDDGGAIELSTVFITLKTGPLPRTSCTSPASTESSFVQLVRSLRYALSLRKERARALVLYLSACLALSLSLSLSHSFVRLGACFFHLFIFLFCFVRFRWRNGFEVSDATASRPVYGERTS